MHRQLDFFLRIQKQNKKKTIVFIIVVCTMWFQITIVKVFKSL